MDHFENSHMWWMVLGVVLMILEVFSLTFVLVFLGGAAFLVGVITYFAPMTSPFQFLLFAILSALSTFFLRNKIKEMIQKKGTAIHGDQHQTIIASHAVGKGQEGVIQYQGAPWTAMNDGAANIEAGDHVNITRVDGVKLFIRKK